MSKKMSPQQMRQQYRMWMFNGRRFSLKEINTYEDVIIDGVDDLRREAMMLFFAEALHDQLGFGPKRIRRILTLLDRRMGTLEGVLGEDGMLDLDKLRLRVFSKTHYMFAIREADQEHIVQMLETAGYQVQTIIAEEEEDPDEREDGKSD